MDIHALTFKIYVNHREGPKAKFGPTKISGESWYSDECDVLFFAYEPFLANLAMIGGRVEVKSPIYSKIFFGDAFELWINLVRPFLPHCIDHVPYWVRPRPFSFLVIFLAGFLWFFQVENQKINHGMDKVPYLARFSRSKEKKPFSAHIGKIPNRPLPWSVKVSCLVTKHYFLGCRRRPCFGKAFRTALTWIKWKGKVSHVLLL